MIGGGWRLNIVGLEAASTAIGGLSAEMRKGKREVLEEAGDDLVRSFRRRILAQQFQVPPLRPATIAKKKVQGYDLRVFVQTEEYVNSFRYRIPKDMRNLSVELYAEGNDPVRGRSYASLAEWLEHGTRSAVPRPHWGPFGVWAQKNVLPKYAKAWARAGLNASMRRAKAKHGDAERGGT